MPWWDSGFETEAQYNDYNAAQQAAQAQQPAPSPWAGVQNEPFQSGIPVPVPDSAGVASLTQRPAPTAPVPIPPKAAQAPVGDWNSGIAYNAAAVPQGFNWQDYTKYNADLGSAGIDTEEEARRHYAMYGAAEGRRMTDSRGANDWGTSLAMPAYRPQGFDWKSYLTENKDLLGAGIDTEIEALRHYNTYGKNEGRQGSGAVTYTNPSVLYTKGAELPKTADGKDYMTWGGYNNLGGKTYAIDPNAYEYVRGQLVQQRDTMLKDPQGARYWTATDKGETTPDWMIDEMAKNLVASGVTDIRQVGKGTVETGFDEVVRKPDGSFVRRVVGNTGGGEGGEEVVTETPVSAEDAGKAVERDGKWVIPKTGTGIINKDTGQSILSTYGGRTNAEQGIWSGTYTGSGNTGFRVAFTEDGLPIFGTSGASSKDGVFRELGKAGPLLQLASFIPGMQFLAPIGQIASGTAALAYGNPLAAIASFAGAVPGVNSALNLGLSPEALAGARLAGQGAGFANAVDKGDVLGAISTGAGALGSANTAFDLGFDKDTLSTIGTVGRGAQVGRAVQGGNYLDAALGAAGMAGMEKIPGTNISVADAAKYVKLPQVLEAAKQGNPMAIAQIVAAMRETPKKAAGGLIPDGLPDKVEAQRILRSLPPDQARMLTGIASFARG